MSRRASKKQPVRVELLETRRLLSASGDSALQDLIALIEQAGATTAWYVQGDTIADNSGKDDKANNGTEPDDVEQNPVIDETETTEPTGNSGGSGVSGGSGGSGEDVIEIVDLPTTPPPFSEEPVTDPTTVVGPVDTIVEAPIDTIVETPIDTNLEAPIDTPIDSPIDTVIDTPIDTVIDTPIDIPVDVLMPTDEPIVTVDPVTEPIDFTDPADKVEEPIVEVEPEQPMLSEPIDTIDSVIEPVSTPVRESVAQVTEKGNKGKDKSDKGDKNDKHDNKGSGHNNIKPASHSNDNDIDTTVSSNHGNTETTTHTVTSPQAPPTETAPTASSTVTTTPATTPEPAATPQSTQEQAAAKESTTAQQQTTSSAQSNTPVTTPVAGASAQPAQAPASPAGPATPDAIVDSAAATAAPVGGGGTILTAEQLDAQAQEARNNNPMIKAVWTFAIEQPLQRVRVVRAQAAAASLAASTINVDPILKVVHELTMATPAFALPAGEGGPAADGPAMGQLTAGQAQIAAALSGESSSLSRNIVLALAAGSAVLAVQWYRARQKKLAEQAMKLAALMQFDPLAVWLDDPETLEN